MLAPYANTVFNLDFPFLDYSWLLLMLLLVYWKGIPASLWRHKNPLWKVVLKRYQSVPYLFICTCDLKLNLKTVYAFLYLNL